MSNEENKTVTLSPLAGKPAPKEMLVDLARLERDYYEVYPDLSDENQRVSFGTTEARHCAARSPRLIFWQLPRRSVTSGA